MKNRCSFASVALALAFVLAGTPAFAKAVPVPGARGETAVFAGGCFWGLEAVFERVNGVRSVVAGYSGGTQETAQYETVSTGRTGHAETVSIAFDPHTVSYQQLLDVFFAVAHDPTQVDRQGPDDGPQYRSVVFFTTDAQRRAATASIAKLKADRKFASPIATQVVPFQAFYAAEAYHQHFFDRNPAYPYIVINDAPKVAALRERFPKLVKARAT